MLIVGLTGGVASGKDFAASHFYKIGIPIFDADKEVHNLFQSQEIIKQISSRFPQSVVNNKIDRNILGNQVFNNKDKLNLLENIIYPKLKQKEEKFLKKNRANRKKIVILNIPLLFEKNGYKKCHKTISIIIPPKTQLQRFKNRHKDKTLDSKFFNITKNQVSNATRKRLADFIIYNGLDKGFCAKQVKKIKLSLGGSTKY